MSELNQAPQSVEPPSEEFFRTGSATKAAPPAEKKGQTDSSSGSSKDSSSSNGASANGANGTRAASLVTAAKAALSSSKSESASGSATKGNSNGAKVSVAPNVSSPNGVNAKAIHPNPTNPNVSALGAPLPKPGSTPSSGAPKPAGSSSPGSSSAGSSSQGTSAAAHAKQEPTSSGHLGAQSHHSQPTQPPPPPTSNIKAASSSGYLTTSQPTAPMVGQVSGSSLGQAPVTSAPRPPAPYAGPTGITGQVRRTVSGATAAAGAVVSGSVDAVRVAAGAETSPASMPTPSARRTRKARLRLSRVDPWSVMKTSFLFAIAGGIILFVAVWVVWGVINASGAFESINKAFNDLIQNPGAETRFTLESYVNTQKVLGFTALIAAADVVIFTALSTLFSFLYNLAATALGGLEVTLAED